MKLSDCTKAELLWVIQRAKEHSLGSINGYLDHALSDLHWKRAQDRLKRAEAISQEADQARGKFVELMRPYDGKKYMDIPRNVLEAAKAAIQRADKLDREYLKIMREVDKLCIKLAREDGWKVGKRGWICPRCQQERRR